jgi:Ca2+/Na+ antiporter
MRRSPDRVSLVAGLVLLALGAVLLLDRLDAIDVRFGTLAPLVLGTVGAILLASGLQRRE